MKKYRFLILTMVAAAFVGATVLLWKPITSFAADPEILRSWVSSAGIWGPLVFSALNILQVIFAVIPGAPFEIAAGYLFGTQHPMDWQPLEETQTAETAEIRAHLLDLGFPEVILNDLAEEDLTACAGALRVDVESEVYSPARKNEKPSPNKRLRMTSIAVQIPGEKETWVIMHHFLWEKGPDFFGTDCLQIWPAYQVEARGCARGGDFTGRVLYDRDGQTYAAPFYFLGEASSTNRGSMYRDTTQQTDIFAGFSLPREGENRRGYLTYTMFAAEDDYFITSYFCYTHQHT